MPEDRKKSGTSNSRDTVKRNTAASSNKTGTARKSEQSSSHRNAPASSSRSKTAQSTTGKKTGTAKKSTAKTAGTKTAAKAAPEKKKTAPAGKKTAADTKKKTETRKTGTARKTEPEKKQKTAPRRGKSRSRAKLLNILPYLLMTLAFIGVMVVLSLTVFFKVENLKVKIEGDVPYPSEDIVNVCPVKTGQNIFSDNIAEAGAIVEAELPYIEHCSAERKMPDTVVLSIVGAKPAGIFTLTDGSRLILSSTGKILEMLAPENMSATDVPEQPAPVSDSDSSATDLSATDAVTAGFMLNDGAVLSNHSKYLDETALAVIEGLTVTGGKVGAPVETEDETVYTTLETIVELLYENELTATRIDLAPGNLYVEYEGRMNIRLGSGSQLEEKMTMAADIIKNRLTKYDSGQIDVSNPQKAYYTPKYITG